MTQGDWALHGLSSALVPASPERDLNRTSSSSASNWSAVKTALLRHAGKPGPAHISPVRTGIPATGSTAGTKRNICLIEYLYFLTVCGADIRFSAAVPGFILHDLIVFTMLSFYHHSSC